MRADRLLLSATVGLVTLIAAIAATFFIAAGSVHPWQGWCYVALFGFSSAAITGYLARHDRALLARRLRGGPQSEQRRAQKLVQAAASLCFLGMFAASGAQWRRMGAVLPPAVSVACDVLVAFGFGLVFLVFRANTFTSATVEVVPGQSVSRTGPYAWVRHPMYSGGLLLLAGTPAALGSTWGWIAVVPLGALIVFRLLDEERLLRRELPGYDEYCNQVRYRLVPGLW